MDVQRAIAALTHKGFAVRYFETAKEAANYLAGSISGKTVGIGGSMTIEQLGFYDRLTKNNTVFWHWKTDDLATRVSAASTQVYLTSANAIAETGEIINIDGSGNRVAATLYNHERVVFVAGVNKLAPDLASALFLRSYNNSLSTQKQAIDSQIATLQTSNDAVKVEIQTLSTRDRVETIASDNGLSLNQNNIITVTTSGDGE